MDALSLYKSGQLRQAIQALGEELRKQPLDARKRTFLFELLCFAGEYARAEKQLDLLGDANKDAAAGALLYRSALHAEKTRQRMFETGEFPAQGAGRQSPPGNLNGTPFSCLTDADPRVGPNLEVFIAGSYNWIPFEYIERIQIERPTKLRGLLWDQAKVRTTPSFRLQDLGDVLLPVLSPLSWKCADEAVALGRSTIWETDERFGEVPLGQKLLAADSDDVPFLEVQALTWKHSAEGPQIASA